MSDPQPAARPRILGPLLIALIFLAIIGGSLGFILGTTGGDPEGSGQQTGDPSTPSVIDTPPAPTTPPSAVPCPEHTEELAGTELTQVLYVQTERSEVWICEDGEGRLFYQGHAGQPGEDLVEDKNAIFLPDVEKTEYGYRARNSSGQGTTEYMVSSKELIIRPGEGPAETEPAVTS